MRAHVDRFLLCIVVYVRASVYTAANETLSRYRYKYDTILYTYTISREICELAIDCSRFIFYIFNENNVENSRDFHLNKET